MTRTASVVIVGDGMNPRTTANYLAFDLGASSGRAVLASFDGETVVQRELHRFDNGPLHLPDGLHWDTPNLLEHIKLGIARALESGIELRGVGVDTWGVDYGLLDDRDRLISPPFHYRDGRTAGLMEEAFQRVPRERIYARTGIQFMALNTVYQLVADQRAEDGRLQRAATLLFMPDLLNFLLTGVKRTDVSIASTSQLLDPVTRAWADDLLAAMDLPRRIFPVVADAATRVGSVRGETALVGDGAEIPGAAGLNVFCPAGHDTACAVAAVPAVGDDWAYVSAGTWCLVGVETRVPCRTVEACDAGLTNELGADGTVRLLRNVTGLWLVQECQRAWSDAGRALTFDELTKLALAAPGGRCLVDPDAPEFAAYTDMPGAIRDACRRTGQPAPEGEGEFIRCAIESVAMKVAWVLRRIEPLIHRRPRVVHVVGGGASNALLCQSLADASRLPVQAGPVEATALGNALLQAKADGQLGTLADIRSIARRSTSVRRYEPAASARWDELATRFEALRIA